MWKSIIIRQFNQKEENNTTNIHINRNSWMIYYYKISLFLFYYEVVSFSEK